jgi:hypothetical protein
MIIVCRMTSSSNAKGLKDNDRDKAIACRSAVPEKFSTHIPCQQGVLIFLGVVLFADTMTQ